MDPYATSNTKVTYYLGAGASAQALPIVNKIRIDDHTEVKGMADCFLELSDELEGLKELNENNISFRDIKVQSLRELAQKSVEFGTIDTYAKYLYLLDKEKLLELKKTLIFFFLTEQLIKRKFDKRSLIFLTTILQKQHVFPSNIKILTWNYDFQIETAASQFKTEKLTYKDSQEHDPPLISYFPYLGFSVFNNEDPTLVHLNEIAGSYKVNSLIIDHFFNSDIVEDFNTLLSNLEKRSKDVNGFLNFAWEQNHISQKSIEYACRIIENTNVLVIIGYSFPFFNREIDKQIFDVFKRNEQLKKIYFQDPFNDGQFIKNQFGLSEKIEILHIKNVKNYYVPMEL